MGDEVGGYPKAMAFSFDTRLMMGAFERAPPTITVP